MPAPMPTPDSGAPQSPPMQDGGDSGGAAALVKDIHDKLMQLGDLAAKSGLPGPTAAIEAYEAYVQQLSEPAGAEGPADDDAPAPGARGTTTPEAGGNPGARPL